MTMPTSCVIRELTKERAAAAALLGLRDGAYGL
jgi:hypothetical protein